MYIYMDIREILRMTKKKSSCVVGEVSEMFRIMLEKASESTIKFVDSEEEDKEANYWDNVGKYEYYEKKYKQNN